MGTPIYLGPFPYWADLYPPPMGYRWSYLTYLPTEERVRSGWPVSGRANFLTRIPYVRESTSYYLIYQEIESMKRYQTEQQRSKGKYTPSNDPFISPYPTLNALCTDAFWDDGKPRDVCNLKIRLGNGQVCLLLNDDDQRASVMTTAPTVAEAMALMDEAMASGKASWKPWQGQGGRRRR